MQLKVPFALVLAGMGLAVASCSTDEITVPKSELYTREFIKQFGVFDPNHEWNHAQRVNVTVTTSTPTDIKIYATVNGTRYLFGTFLGVNGSRDLGVDIPKGITALTLRANGNDYSITPGASITLGGRGRSYYPTTEPGKLVVRRAQPQNDIVKYGSYVAKYGDILPEAKGNLNRENVSLNFRFRQTNSQPIVIYPVMWNTSNVNTLGIYYTDTDGVYHEQDLYTIKDGDFIRRRSYGDLDALTAETLYGIGSLSWLGTILTDLGYDSSKDSFTAEEKKNILDAMMKAGWRAYDDDLSLNPQPPTIYLAGDVYNGETLSAYQVRVEGKKWTWTSMKDAGETLPESAQNERTVYETSGIVVEIPVGTVYGMYIRRADGQQRYSESSKNPKTINYIYDYSSGEPEKVMLDYYYNCPYAATFTREDLEDGGTPDQANQFRRLCFEDWLASEGSDHDMNDMVFYIGGIQDEEVEEGEDPWEPEKPYEWVVAAEDLGNTDDFDFNDVVFGVGNFTLSEDGESATVDVRALASGGTLPVFLYHNEKQVGDEFHSWFGDYPTTTVINATGTASAKGKTVTVNVEKDFTMSCCQKVDGTPTNMGGFTVSVIGKDGNEVTEITAPNLDTNEANFAPQMICVPTHWLWPTERTHILNPYPKFQDWVGNQDNCTDWHENPGGGVIRRTDIPSNTNKPDSGWGSGGGNQGGGDNPGGDNDPNAIHLTAASKVKGEWGNIDVTYVIADENIEKISSASKIVIGITLGQSSYCYIGKEGSGNDKYYGQNVTTITIDEAEKISTLASDKYFIVQYWGLTDVEVGAFTGSATLKIE